MIQAYGFLQFRAQPGHFEEHDVEFRIIDPAGNVSVVSVVKGSFNSPVEDTPTGLTALIQLNIIITSYGTCILCALLDGVEIARTPFTLRQQVVAEKTA